MTFISSLSLFVLAVTSNLAASQKEEKGRVVCYYEQWAIYRGSGGTFAPKDINPYLCTHLIYSFAEAVVEEATLKSADENADFARNGFRDFIDLRTKYNEDLKVLLAIGGYNSGSRQFTPISAKPESRQLFARNSLNYLRKYGFDGLNIDWQFPNDQARSGDAEDFKNFPLLLKDIEKVFEEEAAATGNPKLLLTISVPGKTDIIEPGYDLPELQKYVEFMNVLCYDYHYAYDPYVYHHSPIYPLPDEVTGSGHENEGLNADATINYILSKGVQPDKLNLGIPLYGRGFTLEDENEVTLGSPATGQGAEGKATRETGYKAYFELCKDLETGYAIVRHNETALGPFAYKGNQWVGYDDEESVRRKGEYAKKKGLGGISFWAIDQDDFNAVCGTRAYPLIKAAREGYIRAQKPISATKPSSVPQIVSPTPRPTVSASEAKPSPPRQPIVPSSQRPVTRQRMPVEAIKNTGDYDDTIVLEYSSTPQTSTPARAPTTDAPSGLIQNVYIWITNNIFHNSPPHYFDSSVQSNKQSHSNSTPGINHQGHPQVGTANDGNEPSNIGALSQVYNAVAPSQPYYTGAPSQESFDTGASSQITSYTGVPSQESSDNGAPSQESSDNGAPPRDSSDTGAPSQDSSDIGAPPRDSSDIGAPPRDSSDIGAPPRDSSDTGAPSQESSDTGAPSQESSDIGAPPRDSSDIGAPPRDSSDTGAPSQESSDTGAPSRESSDPGAHTQASFHTAAPAEESSESTLLAAGSSQADNSAEESLSADGSADTAAVTASTDVSVVHVSSKESSSLTDVPSTSSTPKRYTHYYNGVPVWSI